jgi:hypothetical protein
MSEPHPDFTAADPDHQWTKRLEDLGLWLRERSWKLQGSWAWVVLPHGALVGMRVVPKGPHAFKKQLRIARQGMVKPEGFEVEVGVFLKHLGCEQWEGEAQVERSQDTDRYQGTATFLEPAALGAHAKPAGKCARCGKETVHDPAFKEDLCAVCATVAGTEDTEAMRRAREQLNL